MGGKGHYPCSPLLCKLFSFTTDLWQKTEMKCHLQSNSEDAMQRCAISCSDYYSLVFLYVSKSFVVWQCLFFRLKRNAFLQSNTLMIACSYLIFHLAGYQPHHVAFVSSLFSLFSTGSYCQCVYTTKFHSWSSHFRIFILIESVIDWLILLSE